MVKSGSTNSSELLEPDRRLSDTLDELVENEVVVRRMEEDAPVAVYYDLTVKGEELLGALAALDEWAQSWGEEAPEGPDSRLRND